MISFIFFLAVTKMVLYYTVGLAVECNGMRNGPAWSAETLAGQGVILL